MSSHTLFKSVMRLTLNSSLFKLYFINNDNIDEKIYYIIYKYLYYINDYKKLITFFINNKTERILLNIINNIRKHEDNRLIEYFQNDLYYKYLLKLFNNKNNEDNIKDIIKKFNTKEEFLFRHPGFKRLNQDKYLNNLYNENNINNELMNIILNINFYNIITLDNLIYYIINNIYKLNNDEIKLLCNFIFIFNEILMECADLFLNNKINLLYYI